MRVASGLRRSSWALAGGALATYLAVWVLLVNTRIGQQLDDRALLARRIIPKNIVQSIDSFLAFSTPLFAALFCLLFLILGWRTQRFRLGLAMSISVGVTEIVGETVKYFETRPSLDPNLYEQLGNKSLNTFPSGTTALAVGFVLGLIALATQRSRNLTFRWGLLFIQLVAMFVVLAGWHRPSDALGGIALAVFFAAIGLGLGDGSGESAAISIVPVSMKVPWKSALVLGVAIITLTLIVGSLESLPEGIHVLSLVLFMLGIPLFAALMVTKFTRLAGLGSTSPRQNA